MPRLEHYSAGNQLLVGHLDRESLTTVEEIAALSGLKRVCFFDLPSYQRPHVLLADIGSPPALRGLCGDSYGKHSDLRFARALTGLLLAMPDKCIMGDFEVVDYKFGEATINAVLDEGDITEKVRDEAAQLLETMLEDYEHVGSNEEAIAYHRAHQQWLPKDNPTLRIPSGLKNLRSLRNVKAQVKIGQAFDHCPPLRVERVSLIPAVVGRK